MLATRVPHALLLVGPPSVGKFPLAMDLAAGAAVHGRRRWRPAVPDVPRLPDGRARQPPGPAPPGARGRRRPDPDRRPPAPRARDRPGPRGRARAAARRGRRAGRDRPRRAPDERRRAVRAPQDARGAARRHDADPVLGRRGAAAADRPLALRSDPPRAGRRRATSRRSSTSRDLADAPTAARLARLAGGRAGLAVAYAAAPEAEALRGEIGRMLARPPRRRARRAAPLGVRADRRAPEASPRCRRRPRRRRRRPRPDAGRPARRRRPRRPPGGSASPRPPTAEADPAADAGPARKVPAAERRRALGVLLDAWRTLARDLALVQAGATRSIRDVGLLEELEAAAGRRAGRRVRVLPRAPVARGRAGRRERRARSSCSTSCSCAGRPSDRGGDRDGPVADDRPVTDAGARGPARERLDATVRGRVQGVGYRVFALREAMALGVDGYVANEVDGSVRVVAEGASPRPRGPPGAPGGRASRGPRRSRDGPLGAGPRPRSTGSGSRAAATAATSDAPPRRPARRCARTPHGTDARPKPDDAPIPATGPSPAGWSGWTTRRPPRSCPACTATSSRRSRGSSEPASASTRGRSGARRRSPTPRTGTHRAAGRSRSSTARRAAMLASKHVAAAAAMAAGTEPA